ncbi:DEAD/DEAH box helicase [Ekhidna sp. To15]|uniref:DEAD/DEAH box helicase n=1 Tax=Ekhidna sp. To15 TaxID=3395267 RepID=UPI003F51D344
MNNFEKLGLSQSIVEVLDNMGFTDPTPVQQQSIPLLLTENPTDFIGLAQTGTGKTAAFGLPLVDLLDSESSHTQALIMAPTRELGQQTAKQLKDFAKSKSRLNVEVVYGGAAIVNQIKALKRPTQIVVATPGRLLDLIKRKAVKLDQVKYVILDEADEMLNMGFQEAIDDILSHTPEERVTWLFSATMPSEIRRIVKKYMSNPKEVSVNTSEKSNKDISHKYVVTKVSNKIPAIKRFLDREPEMRGIMFCRTKRETQEIADNLSQKGYGVEALHGDLSQAQRDAVMKRFKAKSMQLLVATDVAARGIDVNDLTYVIHHTLPDQLESYTHRSGRTGRAGNKGVSLALINPRESRKISELERKINVTFERVEVPSIDEMQTSRVSNWADQLATAEIDSSASQLLEQVKDKFDSLDKEEILKKLISLQLNQLTVESGEDTNLNELAGASSRNSENSNYRKFFINLGSVDGFIKGDMVHLLSDLSGVDRKHFGNVKLLNNRSYFEVEKAYEKDFSKKFEGVEFEGRAVRVHPDSGPSNERERSTGHHKKKFNNRRSNDRRDGRKSNRRKRR